MNWLTVLPFTLFVVLSLVSLWKYIRDDYSGAAYAMVLANTQLILAMTAVQLEAIDKVEKESEAVAYTYFSVTEEQKRSKPVVDYIAKER